MWKFFNQFNQTGSASQVQGRPVLIETLEDRTLMSAAPIAVMKPAAVKRPGGEGDCG